MDHAVEILQMEPTWNYSHMAHTDSPRQLDLHHPSNHNPNANNTMGAMISITSNADSLTSSDVRPWPISNNSGRCSERHTGSYSKNRDKFTPRKPARNPKRRNMVININGYKKLARKCPRQLTYNHNMKILCQGREDNPVHTDAFNVLIKSLKEKNLTT